ILPLQLLKLTAPILENNFPERQHATYILPVGTMIVMAWKVVATLIDPGTAHKIRLVTGFEHPFLLEHFAPAALRCMVDGDAAAAAAMPRPWTEADRRTAAPPPLPPHVRAAAGLPPLPLAVLTPPAAPVAAPVAASVAASTAKPMIPVSAVAFTKGFDASIVAENIALPAPPPAIVATRPDSTHFTGSAAAEAAKDERTPSAVATSTVAAAAAAAAAAEAVPAATEETAADGSSGSLRPEAMAAMAVLLRRGSFTDSSAASTPPTTPLQMSAGTRGAEGSPDFGHSDDADGVMVEDAGGGGGSNGESSGGGACEDRGGEGVGGLCGPGGVRHSMVSMGSSSSGGGSSLACITDGLDSVAVMDVAAWDGGRFSPVPPPRRFMSSAAVAALAAELAGAAADTHNSSFSSVGESSNVGGGIGGGIGREGADDTCSAGPLPVPRLSAVLYKQRDSLQTRWNYRRRYFVLSPTGGGGGAAQDTDGPSLRYYKNRRDAKSEKVVPLAGAFVAQATHMQGNLYPFSVIPPDGRPIILASESKAEACAWVTALTAGAAAAGAVIVAATVPAAGSAHHHSGGRSMGRGGGGSSASAPGPYVSFPGAAELLEEQRRDSRTGSNASAGGGGGSYGGGYAGGYSAAYRQPDDAGSEGVSFHPLDVLARALAGAGAATPALMEHYRRGKFGGIDGGSSGGGRGGDGGGRGGNDTAWMSPPTMAPAAAAGWARAATAAAATAVSAGSARMSPGAMAATAAAATGAMAAAGAGTVSVGGGSPSTAASSAVESPAPRGTPPSGRRRRSDGTDGTPRARQGSRPWLLLTPSWPPTRGAAAGGGHPAHVTTPSTTGGHLLASPQQYGELDRLRLAFTRSEGENRRLRQCLGLLARRVVDGEAATKAPAIAESGGDGGAAFAAGS
ncbi:unnamed protein product, partial [Phaeothamnion confervicola]